MKHYFNPFALFFILFFSFVSNGQTHHQKLTKSYLEIKKQSEDVCKNPVSGNEYLKWVQDIDEQLIHAKQTLKAISDSLSIKHTPQLEAHLTAIKTCHVSIVSNINIIKQELTKKVPDAKHLKKQVIDIDSLIKAIEKEFQLYKIGKP